MAESTPESPPILVTRVKQLEPTSRPKEMTLETAPSASKYGRTWRQVLRAGVGRTGRGAHKWEAASQAGTSSANVFKSGWSWSTLKYEELQGIGGWGRSWKNPRGFAWIPLWKKIAIKFCQMVVLTCWWRRGGGLRKRELGGGRRRGWREL